MSSHLGGCFAVMVIAFSIGNSCVDVFFFLTGSACLGVALVGSRLFIIVGKLAFV